MNKSTVNANTFLRKAGIEMEIRKNKIRYTVNLIAAVSTVLVLLYALYACAKPYEALKDTVFRLHIIATSDSTEDQNLKLAVRDDLLPLAKSLFDQTDIEQYPGETYAEKTASAAKSMIGILSEAAQQSVYANGSTQTAKVCVGYESFPQKQYEDITMPAGDYWCLRVILGDGNGKNWWCVLYPPLCISPATAEDYFEGSELELLNQPDKYRFRLAILDWFEKWNKKYRKK